MRRHDDDESVRIDVADDGLGLPAAQRLRAVRQVLLALSRFGPRVHRVSVDLAEVANPLGGLDRRCRMRAWMQAGDAKGIGVEVVNGQIVAAVRRAATGLAARLAVVLEGVPLSRGTPAGQRDLPPPGPRRRRRAR